MSKVQVRFRGGVAHDDRGWFTICELDGRRYEGTARYATEAAALEAYVVVRTQVLAIVDKLGLTTEPWSKR